MTPGPDGDKAKQKKGGRAAPKPPSTAANQKAAGQGKGKKKQPQSSDLKVDKVMQVTEAKAGASGGEEPTREAIEASKEETQATRTEPNALLYNPASVLEAAAIKESEEGAERPTSGLNGIEQPVAPDEASKEKQLATPVQAIIEPQPVTPVESFIEPQEELQATAPGLPEELQPKRKVAKTILFDTASVMEAAGQAAKQQDAVGNQPGASDCDIGAVQEAPPDSQSAPRKVAKTLLYDSAKLLEAANAAAHAQAPVTPESATQDFATQDLAPQALEPLQSPIQEAAHSDPEKPARKVPKTILYDTAKVVEAANAVLQARESAIAKTLAETVTEPVAAVSESSPDGKQELTAEPVLQHDLAHPDLEKPVRKVPKTILYDTAKILEAANTILPVSESARTEPHAVPVAEPAALIAEALPELNLEVIPSHSVDAHPDQIVDAPSESNTDVPQVPLFSERPAARSGKQPAFDDPPPELNIDSPPVRLFFEEPATTETAITAPLTAGPVTTEAVTTESVRAEPATAESVTAEEATAEKAKRRVPRTLLYNPVFGEGGIEVDPVAAQAALAAASDCTQVLEPQLATDTRAPRRISTKKIAKTLIYSAPDSPGAGLGISVGPDIEARSQAEEQLTTVQAEKVVERYIAKTMLDHSILYKELSKSQQRIEEKIVEKAKEKANEPFKPFFPIEYKNKALPCTWTWDESNSTEKYRYCGLCQRAVYNFSGLEIADAEALILKAENTAKYTLYKRTDGKFMTSDCPVAVKKRSDFILIIALSVLLGSSFVVFLATLPKPKPKPAPAPVATIEKRRLPGLPKGKVLPGSGHYEAGKGIILDNPTPTPAPVQPAPAATTSGPESDENPVWEFNQPQQGNQQIIDPRAPAPISPQPAAPVPSSTLPPSPTQSVTPNQQPGDGPGQSPYVQTYH